MDKRITKDLGKSDKLKKKSMHLKPHTTLFYVKK